MITLSQRLKRQQENSKPNNRISVRDKLLTREVQEMSQLLPSNCSVCYNNINELSTFILTVRPVEGFWQDGCFKFTIQVTEEYNMVPPQVKCITRLWHPNISESGEVCLSLLRQHSVDGLGWSPTRRLKDVIWGLNSLFTDLLNFEDPLNIDAAEMYRTQTEKFKKQVRDYVELYAREN